MKDKLFKILVDGKSCHGGEMKWSLPKKVKGKWIPGKWQNHEGEVTICETGLHLTKERFVWYKWGCTAYEAEAFLTESLKEAFADGRADMKAECIAAVEKLKVPDRNNPKSIRVAAALGKEQTRKGPIACARSDGYEVATSEILAALQAIEALKQKYISNQ